VTLQPRGEGVKSFVTKVLRSLMIVERVKNVQNCLKSFVEDPLITYGRGKNKGRKNFGDLRGLVIFITQICNGLVTLVRFILQCPPQLNQIKKCRILHSL